jgi:hypothetical protein
LLLIVVVVVVTIIIIIIIIIVVVVDVFIADKKDNIPTYGYIQRGAQHHVCEFAASAA